MKKLISLMIALCLFAAPTAFAKAADLIVIGATPSPHGEILEMIKDDMWDLGYSLEIMIFTEYPLPNPALDNGELDANFFQHKPYLNAYNDTIPEDRALIAAIPIHYEPFGLYAGRTASLDELAEGAVITITNDPSNETRGLLLLAAAGLITLPEGTSVDDSLTVMDIVSNPLKLDIREIDASQLPSTLEDVDMAVINGNFAMDAGLKPSEDALFLEPLDSEAAVIYTNYVVVRGADADAQWVKDLESALYQQKVIDYIMECGLVPAFIVEAE
jgi:D-methionine transport system substrate-binding protein